MPKAATSQKSKATPRVNGNGGDSVEDRLSRIEDSIIEIKTRLDHMPTHKDYTELIKINAETTNKMHYSIDRMQDKAQDSINRMQDKMRYSINEMHDSINRTQDSINRTHDKMHDSINGMQDTVNGLQDAVNKAIYKSALLTLGIISVVATVTGIILGFFLG